MVCVFSKARKEERWAKAAGKWGDMVRGRLIRMVYLRTAGPNVLAGKTVRHNPIVVMRYVFSRSRIVVHCNCVHGHPDSLNS